jgi:glutamate synthase (NADPH/NADH) small chain
MRRGASLIVWAIREGRDAAAAIDRHLRQATSTTRRHAATASA